MSTAFTLDEQIRCVGREIGMRKNAYKKFVGSKRMTQADADRELATMAAVYETLKALKWIPVSERLPDAEECVMIQMADGEVWTGFYDGDDGWRYVSADPASGVQAWRQMPG